MLLEYKECKEQATRIISDQDTEADWNTKNLKAIMIIMSTDMMTKFDGIYTSKSTALQILQRGKMEEKKLNNYTEVDEFFMDFKQSSN